MVDLPDATIPGAVGCHFPHGGLYEAAMSGNIKRTSPAARLGIHKLFESAPEGELEEIRAGLPPLGTEERLDTDRLALRFGSDSDRLCGDRAGACAGGWL